MSSILVLLFVAYFFIQPQFNYNKEEQIFTIKFDIAKIKEKFN